MVPFKAGSTSLAKAGGEEARKARQVEAAVARKVLRLTTVADVCRCDWDVDLGVE